MVFHLSEVGGFAWSWRLRLRRERRSVYVNEPNGGSWGSSGYCAERRRVSLDGDL